MGRKKINVTLDEQTIDRLDAEVRRHNERALRSGGPQHSRSSLIESLCARGLEPMKQEFVFDMRGAASPDEVLSHLSPDEVVRLKRAMGHRADAGSTFATSDLRGMAAWEQLIERVAGMVPLDEHGDLEQ